MPPLENPQHERFACACAAGQDHGQAYITAGYMSSSQATARNAGQSIYKRPDVAARITELQEMVAAATVQKAVVTVDWVIDNLRTVVERCMQAYEVTDSKGQPTGVWRFEPAPTIRALELLGKNLGMFREDLHVTGDITITSLIDRLKDRRKRLVEDVTVDVTPEASSTSG